jgi:hypothetical protein
MPINETLEDSAAELQAMTYPKSLVCRIRLVVIEDRAALPNPAALHPYYAAETKHFLSQAQFRQHT